MHFFSTFTSTTHSSPQAEPSGAMHRIHKAQVPQWLKFTFGPLLAISIFSTDLAGKNLHNGLLGGTYALATPVDGGPPCSDTPTAYTVTGGGDYCTGSPSNPIGLSDSETGVTYELYALGVPFSPPIIVNGTGDAISFGSQNDAIYTVVATRTVGGCTANMTGSAIVTAVQAILYVKTAATGTGDGSSWANASADLQAMLAAPCVQEIWVAAGTYYPTATTDQGIFFNLPSGVKLYGGFDGTESMLSERDVAANPTILSGNIGNPGMNNDNSDRVIVVSNGAAGTRIDGFTISDANNDYTNGAVNVGNSTLDIAFCTFLNNTAYAGGGLGFSNSTVNIDHCLFHDNYGAAGGGAISSNDGTLIVTNTIFRNNNGGDSGGAFFSQSSPNASFTNCLFYRNSVNFFDGSAIFSGGTIALSHCTVVGNTNRRALALLGTGTADNCIVWGNPAGGFGGSAVTVNNSITQNNANTGTGNVSQDPLFADAADPDGADNIWGTSDDGLVPTKCSPAIDAAAAPYHATDLAGNSPQDAPGIGISPADMGAYEQQDVDYPAVITDISVTVPTAFEDNGTICTSDDTFLGDVTVTFANFTSTGTLTVTSDHIVTPVTPVVMGSTTTSTSHTFSGVSMRADNGAITVAASISDAPCSLTKTDLGTALGTGLGYVECTDCGTKWYDLGGPTGNYPNESQTKTFCPQTTDHKAQLEFVSLQLAAGWDELLIYDGYNTNGNQVAYLNSESSPATYTATNPTGCLTAAFFSYTDNEAAGWEANFNCVRIYKIESSNISSCTPNSTSCPDDDTYTADITIYFASLPTSGTLNLSGGDIVGTPPAPVPIGDLSGGSYTFTGVTLRADGNPVILTALFSEETSDALVQTMDNAPTDCSTVQYNLFGVDPFSDKLFKFSTSSWDKISEQTLTMSDYTIQGANSITQNPVNDLYYVILKVSVGKRRLATVDPATGICTYIGNLGDNFSSITFAPDGTLYGCTGTGAEVGYSLYTIDPTTAAKTLRAELNDNNGQIIAFNPDDNFIYYWSYNYMGKIDPSNYSLTEITLTGDYDGEPLGAVYKGNGEFYVGDWGVNTYVFNTSGVSTQVGTDLSESLRGYVFEEIPAPSCDVSDISIANIGTCNDNGTATASDDTFTSDVNVTFAFALGSGDLTLKRGSTVVATKPASDLACVTSWTFTGVQMATDGASIVLTAAFDNTCTFTSASLGIAPVSCSCIIPAPNGIEVSNASGANCNNTTCTTDDTFTADVTVTYESKPASGTLSLTGPTVVGTVPAVDVANIGATSHTFIGVTLKADGEAFALTTAFSGGCDYTDIEVESAPSCGGGGTYTPSSITVSGFGCFGPNGNYQPSGTINGAPFWSSDYGAGLYRIAWAVTRWEIQDAEGTPYAIAANTNGSITNLPCSGGWTDPNEVDCIDTPITLIGGCGDLSVPAGPACDIIGMSIGNMGNCNDNGTTDGTDDYFVAGDVAVVFAYAPGSGDLVLKRGNIVLATKSAAELSCITEWYFLNVQMVADGQPLGLTAGFTDTDCALTQNFGNAPASCSCVPTSAFTTCPLGVTVNVAPNSCAATATYTAAANGDPAPTYSYAFTDATTGTGSNGTGSGSTFQKGQTTVTLTATNACGATNCSFVVTVVDNILPAISCPSSQSLNTALNQCTAVATWNAPVGTDNCPGQTTAKTDASGLSSGSAFPRGATTIQYRVTDAANLSSNCAFTITVTDNQPPAINCPSSQSLNTSLNQCTAVATWTAPVGTDNCPGQTTAKTDASGLSSGSAFPKGVTTIQYRVTDAANLSSNCSFTITVNDGQNPSITCPANIARGTDLGQCSATVTYGLPTTSDNCGATLTRTGGPASGSAFPKGITMVNWISADAAGNSAVCQFTVTVSDGQAPTITCPANVVKNTDAGRCDAVVTYAAPIATDNCLGVTVTRTSPAGTASGSIFLKGPTTVTWEARDAASPANTRPCSFTVTVNDNQVPSITCPANQAKGTDAGGCTAVATYATPMYSDNCTGGSVAIQSGLASGSAFPKGINTVVWRATDGAGLTKTCTFRVTVNDTQAPTVTCPINQTRTTDPILCTAVATYANATFTDNCTGGSVVKMSGLASGSAFLKGINSVVYRATDAAGNQSFCTMTVTVTDAHLPTVTCPANIAVTGTVSSGVCSAMATYTTPAASDNCALQSSYLWSGLASGSVFPVGITTNIWRATDEGGLSATCAFTVTVSCGTGQQTTNEERGTMTGNAIHSSPLKKLSNLDMRLAPNPASTEVIVSMEGLTDGGGMLTLFDAQGRVVWQQSSVQHPAFSINVSDLPSGLYRVCLQTENGLVTKGLVVSKW